MKIGRIESISIIIIMVSALLGCVCTPALDTSNQEQSQNEVTIPDPNLEKVIRAEDVIMGKEAIITPNITITDLEAIKNLRGTGKNINDLSGLQYCVNMEQLQLFSNNISDISQLANLTKLERLLLGTNNISDLSALSGLSNIWELGLSENNISNIDVLVNMPKLRDLNLDRNNISDISALAGLTYLELLHIGDNKITDISALANLTDLMCVYLNHNSITDITPLVDNPGISDGDLISLHDNPLDKNAYEIHIPALLRRGVSVLYD